MLAGGKGADRLEGRDGNDVLVLDGNDNASGGPGDDRFVIGLGNPNIDGGIGNDTLDFGTINGTIRIDSLAGTYTAELEFDQPVWKNGSGIESRNSGGVQLTPQDVLEADATFANSTNDLARVIDDSDTSLEIDFITGTQSVSGRFSSIEHFVAGAANLIGSSVDDRFNGNDGVNVFQGLQGNDILDGGGDSDTAIYTNTFADYTITRMPDGFEVTDTTGLDGQDRLINIERLQFSDIGIAYDLDTNAGQVAKLLGAVFGREFVANREFVGIGLNFSDGGMTYEELAELAIMAAGATTPQEIVTRLWTNIVGSPPAAEQAQPFIDMLNNGTTTGELGVLAAETGLNAVNIDLVGLSSTGIEYL